MCNGVPVMLGTAVLPKTRNTGFRPVRKNRVQLYSSCAAAANNHHRD